MKNLYKKRDLFRPIFLWIAFLCTQTAFSETTTSVPFLSVLDQDIQNHLREKALETVSLFNDSQSHTYFLLVNRLPWDTNSSFDPPRIPSLADKLFFSMDGKQFYEVVYGRIKFFRSPTDPLLAINYTGHGPTELQVECGSKKMKFKSVFIPKISMKPNQVLFQPLDQAILHFLPKSHQVPADFPEPCKVLAHYVQ